MSNTQPRYRKPAPLLAYVVSELGEVLRDSKIDDSEIPTCRSIYRAVRLAYIAAEMVERDCERAVKCLRMGEEHASDRYCKARERDVDELIEDFLAECEQAKTPHRLERRGVEGLSVARQGGSGLLLPRVYHGPDKLASGG